MKKLDILKGVTSIVVSIGVGAIVSNVVKATTPEGVKLVTKVCLVVGGAALSGLVGDAVSKYVGDQIDIVANDVQAVWNNMTNNTNTDEVEIVEET